MIVIVALSENGGMTFNHRRQSKDIALRERIFNLIQDKKLFVNEYTAKQFEDVANLIIDDNCLASASNGDYVFVENQDVSPYQDDIERLIVYRWNRDYPADTFFPIDLNNWHCSQTFDFEGNSHEKITEYVFEKM